MNTLKITGAAALASMVVVGHHQYTHSIPFLYNRSIPSVVSVTSIGFVRNPFDVNGPRLPDIKGSGTGFIVRNKTKKPIILTNYHVIEDSDVIIVKTLDKEKSSANILFADPLLDVAALEVDDDMFELNNMMAPPLCTQEPIIGEDVIAIGNPFGLENSVSTGIISGLDRELPNKPGVTYIQTDAPINPGNSGGPLISKEGGCIIGMNTALISPTGVSAGVGFAIHTTNDMIKIITAP